MNPRLSGVGIRRINHPDITPTDLTARYDDPDLDPACSTEIILDKSIFYESTSTPKPAWGFPFHECCWVLLKAAHHPNDVDIPLLNSIYRSFPSSASELFGLYNADRLLHHDADPDDVLPGGDSMYRSMRAIWAEVKKSPYYTGRYDNPLYIPDLQHALERSLKTTQCMSIKKGTNALASPLAHQIPLPDYQWSFCRRSYYICHLRMSRKSRWRQVHSLPCRLRRGFGLPVFNEDLNFTMSLKHKNATQKHVAGEYYIVRLSSSNMIPTSETDTGFGIVASHLKTALGVYHRSLLKVLRRGHFSNLVRRTMIWRGYLLVEQ